MKTKNKKIFNICMTCLLTITISAGIATYVNISEKKFEDDATTISNDEEIYETGGEINVNNDLINNIPKDIFDNDFYKKNLLCT